jgi:hypothetical protein
MQRRTVLGLAIALAAASAFASPRAARAGDEAPVASVTRVIRSRLFALTTDLVFLSEGYAREEQGLFLADARAMVAHVERDAAAEPFRASRVFNYHFVFVPSARAASPGEEPARTPFRAHVVREKVLVDGARVERAAEAAPDADLVVVLVHFGPGAPAQLRATARVPRFEEGSFHEGRIAIPSTDDGVFLHELGHALCSLGDEYGESGSGGRSPGWVAEHPNLTIDRSGARWHWVSRPTSGCVEGGGLLEHGVFHAEASCIMSDVEAPRFCSVCAALIRGVVNRDPARPVSLRFEAGWLAGSIFPGGTSIEARWDRGGPDPVSYRVELERLSGGAWEPIRAFTVEGHLVSLALGALAPGRYRLELEARNAEPHRAPRLAAEVMILPTAVLPSSPERRP